MEKVRAGLSALGWTVAALVLLFLIFARGVFVGESSAVKALEVHGFQDVEVTHKAYFFIFFRGGSKGDVVRFTCRATNPAGERVTVYAFSQWPFGGTNLRTP